MLTKEYIRYIYVEHLGGLSLHLSWKEHRMLDEKAFFPFIKSQRRKALHKFVIIIAISLLILILGIVKLLQYSTTFDLIAALLILSAVGLQLLWSRIYFRLTMMLSLFEEQISATECQAENMTTKLAHS